MQLKSLITGLATAALVLAAACSTPQPATAPPPPPPTVESVDGPAAPESVAEPELIGDVGSAAGMHISGGQGAAAAKHKAQAQAQARASMAQGRMAMAPVPCCFEPFPQDRENYKHLESNPVQRTAEQPVSTFSIDVDTGSYANVRRMLREGRLPPQGAVRVEELVNYFDYAYAAPRDHGTPFSVVTELAPTPWNARTQLLHIGIQGWKPERKARASNLVFLVDVSGSMNEPDKLPLVKSSLKMLTRHLGSQDRVSLVVYAGASGVVLEPTPGSEGAQIAAALERLEAGGSTNGGEGIRLAYAMAQRAFIQDGNNRVLLATDGDFNVGTVNFEQLVDLVEEKRKTGIALTTLGFGSGNYNDHLMEQLADAGNGNHAYIDSLSEAQKVLVEQRDATLTTIARDVKIQVEFNPAVVAEYRLVGYENRVLKREDFSNDKVDAGEIGAGHTVTALYEIALAGEGGERIEGLRYGAEPRAAAKAGEIAFLRLRYKKPAEGMDAASHLIERPIARAEAERSLALASAPFRLAAAVAAFGQLLRGGVYTEKFTYTDVERLARAARGEDPHGYAGEFLQLVKLAQGLSAKQARIDTGE